MGFTEMLNDLKKNHENIIELQEASGINLEKELNKSVDNLNRSVTAAKKGNYVLSVSLLSSVVKELNDLHTTIKKRLKL